MPSLHSDVSAGPAKDRSAASTTPSSSAGGAVKPTGARSRQKERNNAPGGKDAPRSAGGKGLGKSQKGWGANAPPGQAATGQIQQLKEMGFSEEQARQALAECVWDVNKALDLLFTRGTAPLGTGEGAGGGNSSSSVVDKNVRSSESKGSEASKSALSPVAPGKARASAEGVVGGDSSPGGVDTAEQSTTASTTSSPRSAGGADKSEKSASASAPLSPQTSGNLVGLVVEEEKDVVAPIDAAEVLAEPRVLVEPRAPESAVECNLEVQAEFEAEEKLENAVVEKPVVDSEVVSEAEAGSSPQKRLTRVSKAWEMEGTDAQLCVQEGDFVSVWHSSVTEHGWIYAEDPKDSSKAGWLPGCVLEELPSTQRWMVAVQSMEAMHQTQLSVAEGSFYKVSIDTRTKEGWTYAEANGIAKETADASSGGASQSALQVEAGWVPAFCFDWE
jgi:hypothetical protein